MITLGIDIGGKQHAVARCREGEPKADREVLRVSQGRAGYDRLVWGVWRTGTDWDPDLTLRT